MISEVAVLVEALIALIMAVGKLPEFAAFITALEALFNATGGTPHVEEGAESPNPAASASEPLAKPYQIGG